jgi:hypothetical protein
VVTTESGSKHADLHLSPDGSSFEGQGLSRGNFIHAQRLGDPSPGTPATASIPPATPAPVLSEIRLFSTRFPLAAEWADAPLSVHLPEIVSQNVATLQAALQVEGARTPQASAEAYSIANEICDTAASLFAFRAQTLARNSQLNHGAISDAWENDWANRIAATDARLQRRFAQFRQVLAQSPKPAVPPDTANLVSVDFPVRPVPAAPRVSPGAPSLKGANPLDRGAYDRHQVVVHGPWTIYR